MNGTLASKRLPPLIAFRKRQALRWNLLSMKEIAPPEEGSRGTPRQ